MTSCWVKDPEKRPSFKEICSILQQNIQAFGFVNLELGSTENSISPSGTKEHSSPKPKKEPARGSTIYQQSPKPETTVNPLDGGNYQPFRNSTNSLS